MPNDQPAIRDDSDDECLRLVLLVDGRPWASATAKRGVVDDMDTMLGVPPHEVLAELRSALEALYRNDLEKVTIARLRELPAGSRKFAASYRYRDHRDVSEGIVWYDLEKSETSPEAIPAIVRNMMRFVTHQQLVAGNKAAEDLLGFFKP